MPIHSSLKDNQIIMTRKHKPRQGVSSLSCQNTVEWKASLALVTFSNLHDCKTIWNKKKLYRSSYYITSNGNARYWIKKQHNTQTCLTQNDCNRRLTTATASPYKLRSAREKCISQWISISNKIATFSHNEVTFPLFRACLSPSYIGNLSTEIRR